jgi:hypothetical protein
VNDVERSSGARVENVDLSAVTGSSGSEDTFGSDTSGDLVGDVGTDLVSLGSTGMLAASAVRVSDDVAADPDTPIDSPSAVDALSGEGRSVSR